MPETVRENDESADADTILPDNGAQNDEMGTTIPNKQLNKKDDKMELTKTEKQLKIMGQLLISVTQTIAEAMEEVAKAQGDYVDEFDDEGLCFSDDVMPEPELTADQKFRPDVIVYDANGREFSVNSDIENGFVECIEVIKTENEFGGTQAAIRVRIPVSALMLQSEYDAFVSSQGLELVEDMVDANHDFASEVDETEQVEEVTAPKVKGGFLDDAPEPEPEPVPKTVAERSVSVLERAKQLLR